MKRYLSHFNLKQLYVYEPIYLGSLNAVSISKLIDILHSYVAAFSLMVRWLCFHIIIHYNYKANKKASTEYEHNALIEATWTTVPSFRILMTRLPSFSLLYLRDEYHQYEMCLKISGNQWYWTYELETSTYTVEVDAGILDLNDLTHSNNTYRVACTSSILLPVKTYIRGLVSSNDVLHSWAVPGLGIKRDACPGRSNQIFIKSERLGTFYGQCSEFCGRYHGYRPIEIRFIRR